MGLWPVRDRRSTPCGHLLIGPEKRLDQVELRLDRPNQGFDVTDRVGSTPVPPVGIVDHLWNVIWDDETAEAGLFERADRIDRVAIAIPQKTFGEIIYRTLDISQVNIKDFASAGEIFKRFLDPLASAHF